MPRHEQPLVVERVYREVESEADREAQRQAVRVLLAAGRCVCGAEQDLVRRQYYVGGDGYRWFSECRDHEACAKRREVR